VSDRTQPQAASAVWTLTAALAAASVALLGVWTSAPAPLQLWAPLVCVAVLAVGFAAAESFLIHLPLGRHAQSFSVAEVPLVVGLFIAAPWLVAVARVIGVGTALTRKRITPLKIAFTLAQFAFETAVVAVTWHAVAGSASALSPRAWLATIVAVLVGDTVSALLVTLAVQIHDRQWDLRGFATSVPSGVVPALANASLGLTVVFVAVIDWRALWLPGVVVGVLFLAHRANLVLRRRHDAMQRLNQFTGDVGGHLHVDAVAEEVLAQLCSQLQTDHALLIVADADTGERTWMTGGAALDALATLPAQATVLKRSTRDAHERQLLAAAGVKDAMAVTLPAKGGLVGRLVVADRVGDFETFGSHDLEVLQALANHTAAALRNAQLADKLRRQAAENQHRALHDALTDLPNRRLFAQRVAESTGTVAVLLLDLDGFKEVNDALGHGTGDVLLQLVAQRLTASLPDARCVARIGGDEFVIALDVPTTAHALAAALEIRTLLLVPFQLADMALSVDASIGVAVSAGPADSAILLKQADVAMYDAKTARAGVRLYDAERDRSSPERLLLPSELREAISAGALTVHYQPKATLGSDAIEGFEALVRWNHPRRGLVPPDEFIPLAEQTGLIVELTDYVLDAALAQCRGWRDAGYRVSIAVNMSPRVLHDDGLCARMTAALKRHGLPPDAVTLEITESALMADPARGMAILNALSRMGMTLSVDDLGTGYSSLSHLRRMPVQEVKVDRSFVMSMATDEDDRAIVQAIVELGHRLGKRVVAEGVEDIVTYTRLREMGCDVAQGYWLSRPMTAEDATAWLLTRSPAVVDLTALG
jgi:diguanylate cyclase (GGDEF)-like protein